MVFARDVCRRMDRAKVWLLSLAALLLTSCGREAGPGAPGPPGQWLTLKRCRLLENTFNDGDSFHVRFDEREFIFRLYFVDCPEVTESDPERNREQCRYFGVTAAKNRAAGIEAGKVTAADVACVNSGAKYFAKG